ncbi:MAG: ABC transporter permease [Elusimicrobia bacterium]|nr:ABC transporter permease [Elusimicrobiota bacterium]
MNKTILGFLKKEFAQTLRDPVMRVFIFAAPLIQLLLFGYAISMEFRNLKMAVIYEPSDYIARQLSENIYASGWFVGAELISRDPEVIIRSGKADVVLSMPRNGLTKTIKKEGSAKIQLLIDSQNSLKARAIEAYINSITKKFIIERFPAQAKTLPVSFDVRILFNPTLQTNIFMVPGVMTLILCIVTMMLTGMSLAREKEMGTFETIIAAPLKNIEIIIGKTLPYLIIGLCDASLILLAGIVIFDMPVRGSVFLVGLAALIFVCATVSIGMLISTFAKNQQQAMMGTFLFLFPAALMSGIFYPVESMPPVLRFIGYLDPLKYFISILRNIMLKGANPEMVWSNLAVLVVMTIIIVFVTNRRFHQTLN